jgi:hypothetical protein
MQTPLHVSTSQLASARVLQEFLSGFSRLLLSHLSPDIPEQRVQAAVNELLGSVGANAPKPVNVRLQFKHVCKCVSLQQQQQQQQRQLSVQEHQGSAGKSAGCHVGEHASLPQQTAATTACCAQQLPVNVRLQLCRQRKLLRMQQQQRKQQSLWASPQLGGSVPSSVTDQSE